MNDAFISFDPSIKSNVEALHEQLKKHKFVIYRDDTESKATSQHFNKIRNSIDKSKCFIVCVTKSYAKNQSCVSEIDYAEGTHKPKVVIMFENASYKELDHLGFLIAGHEFCSLYEDRDKAYLKGAGPQFEQIVEKLKEAIQKADVMMKKNEKVFDFYITYEQDELARVETFAKKLESEKNLKVAFDHYRYKNKNRKPNFNLIKNSKSCIAVITNSFLKSAPCLEELSFIQRTGIPIHVIMDSNVKIDQSISIADNIQDIPSNNIIKDLSIIDKPLDKISFL